MAENYSACLIVNPQSGNGRTGREWSALEAKLDGVLDPGWSVSMTSGPMTAPDLTRRALKKGYGMIVSVGGDGTNNEVINGFFEGDKPINPDAVFAHIPRGTGGDFRKTMGYAGTAQEVQTQAIEALRGRAIRPIDLGRMEYIDHNGRPAVRRFLNIASFGIGGEVDAKVNRATKLFGGKASFLIGSIRAALEYKPKRVRVLLDGKPYCEDLLIDNVAVANGKFFGGGMKVAPEAIWDDGLFDVIFMESTSLLQGAKAMRAIYSGTHVGLPWVASARAATVEVESDETVLIDLDGEQPGKLPVKYEVLPKALKLKVREEP